MIHPRTFETSSSIATLRNYTALLILWSATIDKIATFRTEFIIKVNIFWLWWGFRGSFRVHIHFLEQWLLWKSILDSLSLHSNHVWAKRFFHARDCRALISLYKANWLTSSCLWGASLSWSTNNIEPWVPKRGENWQHLISPGWLHIRASWNSLTRRDCWQ